METIGSQGRTAIVYRLKKGLLCKTPRKPKSEVLKAEFKNAFAVEKQLLERLGAHSRIVQYYGPCEIQGMEDGLLLKEANCGDLQSYLDENNGNINDALREELSIQIAEAVAYVHEKGIIHSNISLANILVHQTDNNTDLILADFGGSRCLELGLNGCLLPDDPYFDPQLKDYESPKLDVFSLGIVIYIIMTGQYPFQNGSVPGMEKRFEYGDRVQKLFNQGKFPNLSGVPFGDVIAGCCCERRFETAKEVVIALKAEKNT